MTLALDDEARPQITVEKAGKPLKAIPLRQKRQEGRRTHCRSHGAEAAGVAHARSLEAAMCRGDTFTIAELQQLCRHPILSPQLSRLVLVGEGISGYPEKGGNALRDAAGKLEPVKKGEQLRIAHSHDLLESNAWSLSAGVLSAERVAVQASIPRVVRRHQAGATHAFQPLRDPADPAEAGDGPLGAARLAHSGRRPRNLSRLGADGRGELQVGRFAPGCGRTDDRHDRVPPPRRLSADEARRRAAANLQRGDRDIDLVVSVAHRGGVDPRPAPRPSRCGRRCFAKPARCWG